MDGTDLAEVVLNQNITLECSKKSLDNIINVHQAHHHLGVVDCNRKVVGDVVTEGCHRTVVVGPAPLAEYIGKAEYIHDRPCLLGIAEEQVLARLLAPAVGVVQLCLDGGSYENGTGIVVPLQGVKQGIGETEVARHELLLVLWPVHPGKVEYEFTVLGVYVQLLWVGVEVVEVQVPVSLASQLSDEILPHEAVRAGYEYPHASGSPMPSARPGCTSG